MKTEDQTPTTSAPADDIDPIGPDKSLLIVDDDGPFLRRLARAMETRGFAVDTAETVSEGIARSRPRRPNMRWSICGLPMATGWK